MMKIKNRYSFPRFMILACVLATVWSYGCKKQDNTYYKFKNSAGDFNGTAFDYLQAQNGIYDSMLLAVSRVTGIKDSLTSENITVFAINNNSFTLALQNLNAVRSQQSPPRDPLYIATVDSAQLDTLLCRYIVHGYYPTDSVSPYNDGVTVQTLRYNYEMQIQYQHASSSGYENGGPESLIFSDRNNSIFDRYWVSTTTNAVDIKTKNAIVHVLSPGHDFGFGQIVQRMNK